MASSAALIVLARLIGCGRSGPISARLLEGLFSFAVITVVVGIAIGMWSVATSFIVATVVTLLFHVGVWRSVRSLAPAA